MKLKKSQLIVALDVETLSEAKRVVNALSPVIDFFKVGSQLFTAYGPKAIECVTSKGKKVFLDLKFHDIPNTVGNAVTSAVGLSKMLQVKEAISLLTVHIVGGREMLQYSVKAAQTTARELKVTRPKILGITVLTSDVGMTNTREVVLQRAALAYDNGLDGVVASCQEAAYIRQKFGKDFIIVTPGIRPAGQDAQDQKRVATPSEAIQSGSNFLVVGRPIVKASNPLQAAKQVLKEMS